MAPGLLASGLRLYAFSLLLILNFILSTFPSVPLVSCIVKVLIIGIARVFFPTDTAKDGLGANGTGVGRKPRGERGGGRRHGRLLIGSGSSMKKEDVTDVSGLVDTIAVIVFDMVMIGNLLSEIGDMRLSGDTNLGTALRGLEAEFDDLARRIDQVGKKIAGVLLLSEGADAAAGGTTTISETRSKRQMVNTGLFGSVERMIKSFVSWFAAILVAGPRNGLSIITRYVLCPTSTTSTTSTTSSSTTTTLPNNFDRILASFRRVKDVYLRDHGRWNGVLAFEVGSDSTSEEGEEDGQGNHIGDVEASKVEEAWIGIRKGLMNLELLLLHVVGSGSGTGISSVADAEVGGSVGIGFGKIRGYGGARDHSSRNSSVSSSGWDSGSGSDFWSEGGNSCGTESTTTPPSSPHPPPSASSSTNAEKKGVRTRWDASLRGTGHGYGV